LSNTRSLLQNLTLKSALSLDPQQNRNPAAERERNLEL